MTDPNLVPAFAALVGGAAASAVIWLALRGTFTQPLFLRKNFRGAEVPVGAGVILFFATVGVWGCWKMLAVLLGWDAPALAYLSVAALVGGGFGLFGLFDDLAAIGDDKGFSGHLRALASGRLTTGGLKLIGGGFLSLAIAVVAVDETGLWRLLLAGAVISLAANLGNLFDRAPARCTKVAVVCAVALVATARGLDQWTLVSVTVVVGAALGLVVFDAREQLMLGDAGSNVLGAILGWGFVATTDWQAQLVVLVVIVALNAASEKVSFSKVIAGNSVLRTLDQIGRRPPPS